MTASAQWAAVFIAVTRAGCTLRTYPDVHRALYLHEKLIRSDGASMLIGSQNATSTSLNGNRELTVTVTVTASALVEAAAATFAADYRTAQPWTK